MTKKYQTLFFDLDDTLWDTAANSKESMKEIYSAYNFGNYYASFEDFYPLYLNYNNQLWDKYGKGEISKTDLMNSRFRKLFEDYVDINDSTLREMNDAFMHNTSLKEKTIDGAVDTLEKLYGEYRLYIISNGFSEVQYTKLKNSGLNKFFDKIFLSDALGINKPDPRIFDYAIENTSADKQTSLMIGDTYNTDIVGAQNSGIDQVWYNPKESGKNNLRATFEISKISQLLDIL